MARGYGQSSDFDDAVDNFRGMARGAGKNVVGIVILVVALIVLFKSFQTIGAGERGVVFSMFGGVQELVLDEGEKIRTEISTKYDREKTERLLTKGGFELVDWYSDEQSLYSLSLARKDPDREAARS